MPGDIAIVGFDDIVPASLVDSPLATASQPLTEMARFAFDVIRDAHKNIHEIPASLVVQPGSSYGDLQVRRASIDRFLLPRL